MGIFGFTTYISIGTAFVVDKYIKSKLSETSYLVIFWTCRLSECFYLVFLPLIMLFFILRNLSVFDDAIGLKKEIRFIFKGPFVIYAVLTLFGCLYHFFLSGESDSIFSAIIMWQVYMLSIRILLAAIHSKSTHWVVTKFENILEESQSVEPNISRTNTFSMAIESKMRMIVHESTVCLVHIRHIEYILLLLYID